MMSRLSPQRSTAGFTLIEVLVVVIMVGILAAIAAPGWLTFMNSRRANAARDQVTQILRQAQEEAIRTKREQIVSFNTTATPPTITSAGVSQALGDGQPASSRLGLQVTNGANSKCGGSASCVVFDDKGNVSDDDNDLGNGIKITVSSPATNGSKRCVIVQTLLGAMNSLNGNDCN